MCPTSDKIKDLLKPGSVSVTTRLALVNAIYFKGNWMNRFDEANTKEMPFKINQVRSVRMELQKFSIALWWLFVVQVTSASREINSIIAKSTLFLSSLCNFFMWN